MHRPDSLGRIHNQTENDESIGHLPNLDDTLLHPTIAGEQSADKPATVVAAIVAYAPKKK